MSVSPSDPPILKSKKELLDYLKSQDIAVPARTQGRTTQHCERHAAFRLLATLATAGRFAYPLTLIHRDRPDFLLRFADRDVGLEFTEALSREEAEVDALAEHMDTGVVLFSDQFTQKDDEEAKASKRTAAQRRQIIQNPPEGGPGWGDDRGVPQWAEWIMGFVGKKTGDLAKPEFDKYSGNWLLVYDNLPVPFAQDTPKRWTDLGNSLCDYFAGVFHYDTVFIDSANELAEFTSTGHIVQPIVNLWRQDESSWSPP